MSKQQELVWYETTTDLKKAPLPVIEALVENGVKPTTQVRVMFFFGYEDDDYTHAIVVLRDGLAYHVHGGVLRPTIIERIS